MKKKLSPAWSCHIVKMPLFLRICWLFVAFPCLAETEQAAVYRQALTALQNNQSQQTIDSVQRLMHYFADSQEAIEGRYLMARAYEQQQNYPEALSHYQYYLRHNKKTVHYYDASLKANLINSALKHDNSKALKMFLSAIDLRAEDRYRDAIAMLNLFRSEHKNNPLADDALHLKAYILLMDMKHYSEAEQSYRQYLKHFPDASYSDNAWYGLAVALENQNKIKQAKTALKRLIKRHTAVDVAGFTLPGGSPLAQIWYNKAKIRLNKLTLKANEAAEGVKQIQQHGFAFGIGDRLFIDQPVGSNGNYRYLWKILQQEGFAVQYLTHWITRNTDWRWEHKERLQAASRAGYTPVVAFWYFGDEISPDYVTAHRQQWLQTIRNRLIPLISELPEVLVLIEPEFNKNGIENWRQWDAIATEAVELIHAAAPGAKVGLTLGNWVDDQFEQLAANIRQSVAVSDFVAFQEMLSQYDLQHARDPSWNPVDRSLRMATRLQQTFAKPIYFAYLAISTFAGKEAQQAAFIEQFSRDLLSFVNVGVFAMSYFSYFDDPFHQGWFAEAENKFGLVSSDGQPKPAALVWKNMMREIKRMDNSPPVFSSTPLIDPQKVDFNINATLSMQMQFNEWTRWKIQVVGTRSKAWRSFYGAGTAIAVSWDGYADSGAFIAETARITIDALDAAGNRLNKTIKQTIDIIRPADFAESYQYALLDYRNQIEQNGQAEIITRATSGKAADVNILRIDFTRPYQSIVLPLQSTAESYGEASMQERIRRMQNQGAYAHLPATDLNLQTSANGFGRLLFKLRLLQGNGEGLVLALYDAKQTKIELFVEPYLFPEQLVEGSYEVSIALRDFPLTGYREKHKIWEDFNWDAVASLALSTTRAPLKYEISEIKMIDRQGRASVPPLPSHNAYQSMQAITPGFMGRAIPH